MQSLIRSDTEEKILEIAANFSDVPELKAFWSIALRYTPLEREQVYFLLSRERSLIYIRNDVSKERTRRIIAICDLVLNLISGKQGYYN